MDKKTFITTELLDAMVDAVLTDESDEVVFDDDTTLQELLVSGKGKNRSMKQYAIDCDVNPSTFSRIINGKVAGGVSDRVLEAIAANADPKSGVTLERLNKANEMLRKDANESAKLMQENTQGLLILKALKKGYRIRQNDSDEFKMNDFMYYRSDYRYVVDRDGEGETLWFFEYLDCVMPDRIFGSMSQYSLMCVKQPDIEARLFLVFSLKDANEEVEKFLSAFKGLDFKTNITIVICLPDEGRIRKEITVSSVDGKQLPRIFSTTIKLSPIQQNQAK